MGRHRKRSSIYMLRSKTKTIDRNVVKNDQKKILKKQHTQIYVKPVSHDIDLFLILNLFIEECNKIGRKMWKIRSKINDRD